MQLSFSFGFDVSSKLTRKRGFPEERELARLIEPRYRGKAYTGRPLFLCELMLWIHCLLQWFGHFDLAMEEALHDVPLYREFVGIDPGADPLSD